ncbi:MAG: cardiolipin synthase [Alloprevotella sp.]|nr:cardiolipin synthase [Alloprevotella sp.]
MTASNILHYIVMTFYVLLIAGTAMVVVLENRKPEKTIAWLIVLTFLPVAGWIFFYFFGQDERRRHILSRGGYAGIARQLHASLEGEVKPNVPAKYELICQLGDQSGTYSPTSGNSVKLLYDGAAFVGALLQDIYAAREHIHIETYIIEDDAVGRLVRDALIERAREGIEVRLLYDDVGCWRVPQSFFQPLEEAGGLVFPFLPVRFPSLTRRANYRNHRKVCVFDGRTGYIGGMNLALRYVSRREGTWHDAQLRVSGSAARSLQATFLSSWYFATGRLRKEQRFFPAVEGATGAMAEGGSTVQIIGSTPISRFPEIMLAVTALATRAEHYLYIQTPYFMPTEPVLQALQTAAMGGVDVRLMLPKKPDAFWLRWANDSFLADVLDAGVRVLRYKAGFLHAKTIVCDDDCCSVGSANMDFRSFENNFEANALVYDPTLAGKMRRQFEADEALCEEIHADHWATRPLMRRALESITRIFSPLL